MKSWTLKIHGTSANEVGIMKEASSRRAGERRRSPKSLPKMSEPLELRRRRSDSGGGIWGSDEGATSERRRTGTHADLLRFLKTQQFSTGTLICTCYMAITCTNIQHDIYFFGFESFNLKISDFFIENVFAVHIPTQAIACCDMEFISFGQHFRFRMLLILVLAILLLFTCERIVRCFILLLSLLKNVYIK